MKKFYILLLLVGSASTIFSQDYTEIPSIEKKEDIDSIRQSILKFIWPNGMADSARLEEFSTDIAYEEEFPPDYLQYLESLQKVDRIKIRSDIGLTSTAYVLHPKIRNELSIPVIYLGGHESFFWEDTYLNNSGRPYSVSVLEYFLSKGFDVIGIDMPLCGVNASPVEVTEGSNRFLLRTHDDIFQLKKNFYYFFEPVRRFIDLAEANYGYKKFIVVGLSGGGWTATLYSGLDDRVTQSYAIAGSIPIPLRIKPSDVGDLEQHFESFYEKFNYSTLYSLAASGKDKLHYQILNKEDNCCFDFDGNDYWVPRVQEALKKTDDPGRFMFYYDSFATMHKISLVALDTIYRNIRRFLRKDIQGTVNLSANSPEIILCEGETVDVTADYDAIGELQWYKNGRQISTDEETITITKPGIYIARVHNISGLSFWSDTLRVSIKKLKQPAITQLADSLSSDFKGSSQWYLNGTAIPGMTSRAIKPTLPGIYSVTSISGHCSSLPSQAYSYGIVIYPVPSNGLFTINAAKMVGTVSIEIFNANGELIYHDQCTEKASIDLRKNTRGMYFVRLTNNKGLVYSRKIIIE